jgi:DNA-binding response OmpR family regulator
MVTRSELQSLGQEVKSQWKGLLALATMLHSRLKIEGTVKPHPEGTQVPSVVILGRNYEASNLRATLEAEGIDAGTVRTLEEAAALTQKEGVRLVVVDESFVDSASACWQLRQQRIVPIVLLGASPENEGWMMAANVEADAYLGKQTRLAEQVARIKAMLRRH